MLYSFILLSQPLSYGFVYIIEVIYARIINIKFWVTSLIKEGNRVRKEYTGDFKYILRLKRKNLKQIWHNINIFQNYEMSTQMFLVYFVKFSREENPSTPNPIVSFMVKDILHVDSYGCDSSHYELHSPCHSC